MLNKIMLIGNLGKDPDMSYTQAGTAITKFSLAVNRRSKDRETGERKDETTWFNVTAFDRLGETCNEFLHKGSKVYIEGRMQSHKYTDKEGVERVAWDVIASEMQMLDPKGASQGGDFGGSGGATPDDIPF
ncbi:MAG TPA: single-stranded DNA-binding protein [Ktedonobacterales bacterium]|jgi:single-strand DNA-binding protein|nr:single-stranded DNA-binding protein [Ktedonobacterales bacterium]